MQSRRHGELKPRSPAPKPRDDRADWRPEHYIRRDDRSPPLRLRRSSLSPPKYERALRIVGREGRSGSKERREYGWELVGGLRTRVRSRSPPPVGHGQKRAHFDDAIFGRNVSPIEMREKYHLMDHLEQADLFDDAKHVYGFEHSNPRMVKERDYAGPILGEKQMILEGGQVRQVLRPPPDIIGPNSNYDEIGGNLGIPSKLDIGWFKEDSHRFGNNQLSMDKLPLVESLKEREKHMVYSRDIPYSAVPVSHFKDLGSTSHLKEFAGTSSGIPRAERIGPFREFRDGLRLPPDEYVNNYAKYTDSADYNGNEHKLHFNTRDIDVERRGLTFQHQHGLGPDMADHPDYLYQKHGQDIDDQGFPSDYSYRKLPSRARGDLAYGESVRQLDDIDDVDGPNMVMRRSLRDHPSLQKQINEDFNDVDRISSTLKQVGVYSAFESGHADLERFSRDDDIINSRVKHDQEISGARLDYEFARDGPGPNKDRLMKSLTSVYDAEKHRFILSQQRMREKEFGIYEPSERVLKRKYIMDEEISKDNSRSALSSRLNTSTRSRKLMDGSEEWIADDSNGLYTSRRAGFDHNQHRKGERTYGADHYRDSVSDDWLSSQDLGHSQGRSGESYRSGARYFRGQFRQGYSSWHNPYQYDRRRDISKQQRFWKNARDDDHADVNEDDVDTSEDFVRPADYEPPEESEEFKQQLHKAFLKFSKKLNENLAVRRRYTEQGKAGSLFCIVCGRSVSKEFMDTQRLVTHAYMSHKYGLRAQHMGLHKAICVLMGWNSLIDPDCVTWVPQALSEDEALAQKEDIILWPPLVIIQNISLINTELDAQKLVTKEELAEFLREKGFTGGKLKVSLGRPANHSFLVVKFMGTFTGLQDAEKLHKFFAENKHGRRDLLEATSGSGKADKSGAAAEKGNLANDQLLYGYMGIADDLDKLDLETKRRSLLKSKKEIQDLADAPVKT